MTEKANKTGGRMNEIKIKKKKSNRVFYIVVSGLVILAVLGLVVYYFYRSYNDPENIRKTKAIIIADCAAKGNPGSYLREECMWKVAQFYKDPAICNNVASISSKWICISDIASATSNLSVCDFITGDEGDRANCYADIIPRLKRPELCEKITGDAADKCYAGSASALLNVELCYNVSEQFHRNSCIESIAIEKKEPEICNRLEYPSDCIITIAEKTRNSSLCAKIDSLWGDRDSCYHRMSQILKDKSLCSKITDGYERSDCQG